LRQQAKELGAAQLTYVERRSDAYLAWVHLPELLPANLVL
jgi:hypothetical protein